MHGIFRNKPTYTMQQICEQLGENAKDIESAASETSDVAIGATVNFCTAESLENLRNDDHGFD